MRGPLGLTNVTAQRADIMHLPCPDGSFDCVVARAITVFVSRPQAAAELAGVCWPRGRVLAAKFYWRFPPTEEACTAFFGQVCPPG